MALILGGGTLGVIGTAILQWWRFRKKDTSETGKIEAETLKIKMEALKTKAEAEVTISEAALKLVQRITEECNQIKVNVERLEKQLIELNNELLSEREKNRRLLEEIAVLKNVK